MLPPYLAPRSPASHEEMLFCDWRWPRCDSMCAWTYLTIKDVLLSAWPELEPNLPPCFDSESFVDRICLHNTHRSNRASTKVTVARRAGSLTLRSSGAETSDLTAIFSRCSFLRSQSYETYETNHKSSYTLYRVLSSFIHSWQNCLRWNGNY